MKKDETEMDETCPELGQREGIASSCPLTPDLRASRIHLLDPMVAGKIAAGEVIERPASVVKELIENSIDASASRIDIQLAEGGKTLIKVIDNGVGISSEDLSMLFLKHATSKISNLQDLEAISTLGFRGEALASIGLVSHTRVLSCARGGTTGAELEVRGGKRGAVKYLGAPEGTSVEVRELFYNVPARRKFLKATPAEMASISEVVTRLALSHPEIHFTLTHNQREVFNLPPASSIKERIAAFFGQDFAKELLFINSREPTMEVSGYIQPPAKNYGNTRMQYTFLNGRYVREGNISHAIQEAYRNLLTPGRYPITFLFLQSEPSLIDVNVHPTKLEVRFREPARVHGQVLQALKKELTQYTPRISPSLTQSAVTAPSQGPSFTTPTTLQALPDKGFPHGATQSLVQTAKTPDRAVKQEPQAVAPQTSNVTPGRLQGSAFVRGHATVPFVQIHRTYIVEETPDGLNIVDQHALHEILLYKELKHRVAEGNLPVQRLLIPELVELDTSSFFNIVSLRESLCKAGVEIEEFGKNTVIVRSLPQVLKDLDIKELITDLTEKVREELGGGTADVKEEQVLDRVLKAMACKGAIKSGQRLDLQEMQALLEKRDTSSLAARCPHGRPTTLFLSLEELDKHFKRKTKH